MRLSGLLRVASLTTLSCGLVWACSSEDKKAVMGNDAGVGGESGDSSGGSRPGGGGGASDGAGDGLGGEAGAPGAVSQAGAGGEPGAGGDPGAGGKPGAGGEGGNPNELAEGGSGSSCVSPTSFSCEQLKQQISEVTYDVASNEVVLTLADSFPLLTSAQANGDSVGVIPESSYYCSSGFKVDLSPASRTLRVAWPQAGSIDWFLRNVTFTDECGRKLKLDPGASCLELRIRKSDTNVLQLSCEDNPYDQDCVWDCS